MKLHTKRELFASIVLFSTAIAGYLIGLSNWDMILMVSIWSFIWTWMGIDANDI